MALRAFVRGMEDILYMPEIELLPAAIPLLATLIKTRDWLPKEFTIPRPERYQQYLLYCDPQERFCIVSFVWLAGQRTPIHDHCVWGLIGQLEGQEQETLYHLSPWRQGKVSVFGEGDVSRVSPTPPSNDIHLVANVSTATAISIHVYGCNIGTRSRHVYDTLTGETKLFVSGYTSEDPVLLTSGKVIRGEKRQREAKEPDGDSRSHVVKKIEAQAVKALLRKAFERKGTEVAFLDVRESAIVQDRGHPLFAIGLSLSNLEKNIARLAPRLSTPIILMDEGEIETSNSSDSNTSANGSNSIIDTRALYCAQLLLQHSYTEVYVLQGGMSGWRKQGLEVFTGCGVPSKAFGEHVCEDLKCPMIQPEELHTLLQQQQQPVIIMDARPFAEYHHMSIPQGLWAGGAELVPKAYELIASSSSSASSASASSSLSSSSSSPIFVVNCAGRTRSIIGAQSLKNAQLPHKVFALAGGTMGWKLAGLQLARNAELMAPSPSPQALAFAQQSAKKVAEKFQLKTCTLQDVSAWRKDQSRNLFLFDVRLLPEYEQGHMEGWSNAPGGQLVQALEEFVGVLGSRVVLTDGGEHVRAEMTASWLEQMGLVEVFVLQQSSALNSVSTSNPAWLPSLHPCQLVTATVLSMWLRSSSPPLILDCGISSNYAKRHIPGSMWISRHDLHLSTSISLPSRQLYVLTDDTGGQRAERTARDLSNFLSSCANQANQDAEVFVLQGGNGAWFGEWEAGFGLTAASPMDIAFRPYESIDAPESAMRGYLEWEYGLCHQVRQDGDAPWRNVAVA